MFSFEKMNM